MARRWLEGCAVLGIKSTRMNSPQALGLQYEQGPWDGVEGAQYLSREVLAALTEPTPVI